MMKATKKDFSSSMEYIPHLLFNYRSSINIENLFKRLPQDFFNTNTLQHII